MQGIAAAPGDRTLVAWAGSRLTSHPRPGTFELTLSVEASELTTSAAASSRSAVAAAASSGTANLGIGSALLPGTTGRSIARAISAAEPQGRRHGIRRWPDHGPHGIRFATCTRWARRKYPRRQMQIHAQQVFLAGAPAAADRALTMRCAALSQRPFTSVVVPFGANIRDTPRTNRPMALLQRPGAARGRPRIGSSASSGAES